MLGMCYPDLRRRLCVRPANETGNTGSMQCRQASQRVHYLDLHVQEELVTSGYMRAVSTDGSMAAKAKAKTRKTLKQQRLSAFRQFSSPGGFPILVGRNNRQNDELTHSIAKAADTWLHARGVPGEVHGSWWCLPVLWWC